MKNVSRNSTGTEHSVYLSRIKTLTRAPQISLLSALKQFVWTSARGFGGWLMIGDSSHDFSSELAHADRNVVVGACLRWVFDNLPEPELQVVEPDGKGGLVPVENHKLLALMAKPNDDYDGETLIAAVAMSYLLSGNAWIYKARGDNGRGVVRALQWLPHWSVQPWLDKDGRLLGWKCSIPGRQEQTIPKDDVIHIRSGIDPDQPHLGFNRLRAAAPAIGSDNIGDQYEYAILKNMGVPGVFISPKSENQSFTGEQITRLKELWRQATTGDQRGSPVGSTIPAEFKAVGFSPEQMALDKLRVQPMTRICSAFGIHPAALGLVVAGGPSDFDNGGQHEAAREASYHDCIIPMQKRIARALTVSLLPEFDSRPGRMVHWCYDDVSVMQENTDAIHDRARSNYEAGLISLNEARADLGLEPVEGGDEITPPAVPALDDEMEEATEQEKMLCRRVDLIRRLRQARTAAGLNGRAD